MEEFLYSLNLLSHMTRLEDFFNAFVDELNIELETEETAKTGHIGDVRVMYIKTKSTEIFSVRASAEDIADEIEADLVEYAGKAEMSFRIGLPSMHYHCFLKRLDEKPLSRSFKEQFAKRDNEQRSENCKFFEYAKIKDTAPVKGLLYRLFMRVKENYDK